MWYFLISSLFAEEPFEEITVRGSNLSRWNNTRWFIKTEVVFPLPVRIYSDYNTEFEMLAVQMRSIIFCEKDFAYSKTAWEVSCHIEDIGLQAAIKRDPLFENRPPKDQVQAILVEMDEKLTGAVIQLQTKENGNVPNLDLEGLEQRSPRINEMNETLRFLMARISSGFDLKMRENEDFSKGQWEEYNSGLMTIAYHGVQMPLGAGPFDKPSYIPFPVMGNATLLHRLDPYQGHYIVQSRGKGILSAKNDFFDIQLSGVAVFDPEKEFMTERVWTVYAEATPSSANSDAIYMHNGRIEMLEEKEMRNCGPTREISPPKQPREGLPPWKPIENF